MDYYEKGDLYELIFKRNFNGGDKKNFYYFDKKFF